MSSFSTGLIQDIVVPELSELLHMLRELEPNVLVSMLQQYVIFVGYRSLACTVRAVFDSGPSLATRVSSS